MMTTVKPTSITDNTPAGARAFIEHSCQAAKRFFRKRGEVLPFALVLGHRDPTTSKHLGAPGVSYVALDTSFFASTTDKNRLAAFLRMLCLQAEAFGIAFAYEAWQVVGLSEEEQKAWDASDRPLEEHPNRREVAMVSVSHEALGSMKSGEVESGGDVNVSMSVAEIKRPRNSRPRLAPWAEHVGPFKGRMVSLLPRTADYERREAGLRLAIEAARRLGFDKEQALPIIRRTLTRLADEHAGRTFFPVEYVMERMREMDWDKLPQ